MCFGCLFYTEYWRSICGSMHSNVILFLEQQLDRYSLKSAAAADDLETPDRLLCNPFQAVCLAATGVNGSLDPGDDLFLATVGTG